MTKTLSTFIAKLQKLPWWPNLPKNKKSKSHLNSYSTWDMWIRLQVKAKGALHSVPIHRESFCKLPFSMQHPVSAKSGHNLFQWIMRQKMQSLIKVIYSMYSKHWLYLLVYTKGFRCRKIMGYYIFSFLYFFVMIYSELNWN